MYLLLPPIAAEKMFEVGGFPITNSYINSTITLVLFVIFAFFIRSAVKKYYTGNRAPRGILNFFESILDFVLNYMDSVTKDRKKTLRFLPVVGTLFFFILISNYMGLLPGTGSIGIYQFHGGHVELIPLFRPANTDLNMTIAMAVLAVASSHILGIFAIGLWKYVNKYIMISKVGAAVKSLNPIKILTAFVEFFVGLLESIAEFAKMLSLSLRLFGNIFAGEVLLTVIGGLLAFGAPLPFMALELLVGAVQAVVFSMLALVYLTLASEAPHGEHEGQNDNHNKGHRELVEEHG
jgi:F-type H+-transporting ATPase subunit a